MNSLTELNKECGGLYSGVVKPERLVFTNNAYDHEGKSRLEPEPGPPSQLCSQGLTRACRLIPEISDARRNHVQGRKVAILFVTFC